MYRLIATLAHQVDLDDRYEVLEGSEADDEALFRTGIKGESDNTDDNHVGCAVPFSLPSSACEGNIDPVQIIVDTIARRPYQYYFRRQRRWHPTESVLGWEARLCSYFWPALEATWEINVQALQRFVVRFEALQLAQDCIDKEVTGRQLLDLFTEICLWGGVRLPEDNSNILIDEVSRALAQLDRGEVPTNCRINSAWTKLYAIARPSTCVIFDSRVAASLTSILDPYRDRLLESPVYEPYRALGYVDGRGGSRPRNLQAEWPNGYQRWDSQCAANRLVKAVVNKLNESDEANLPAHTWTLREVEAVLFMDGY
jgi:hypothetical protein